MDLLNKQKNNWKVFTRERRYNLSFFSLSPAEDWRIMLRIFTVLLVIAGALGFLVGNKTIRSIYNKDTDISAGEVRLVDLERIDQVIGVFESRRANFGAASVGDPDTAGQN